MDKPKNPAHTSSVHQLATALKSLTGEVKLTLVKLLQCSVLLGNLKPRHSPKHVYRPATLEGSILQQQVSAHCCTTKTAQAHFGEANKYSPLNSPNPDATEHASNAPEN